MAPVGVCFTTESINSTKSWEALGRGEKFHQTSWTGMSSHTTQSENKGIMRAQTNDVVMQRNAKQSSRCDVGFVYLLVLEGVTLSI